MMRLRPQTYGKLLIGLLVIGGTLVTLWAIYRPSAPTTVRVSPSPAPPPLHRARALVLVELARSDTVRRAEIRCHGRRKEATGFWAKDPAGACGALVATKGALLGGQRCGRLDRNEARLHATGAIGDRRFDVRQQRGGCPDPHGWLAVNALASPVLRPESELDEARG
jgi:hypothetical protein